MKELVCTNRFYTGAIRDSRTGKGRFDLISPIALRRLADVCELGAIHYGERNWEQGMPISRILDSALRHINQYREGIRNEDHLAHAMWNIMAAIHTSVMVEGGELPGDLLDHPAYLRGNNE